MADLIDDIRVVLREAAKGKGPEPHFVTAYQILDRLPVQRRDELVATYGGFGRGAGTNFGAASALADALKNMGDVETSYLDTRGSRSTCRVRWSLRATLSSASTAFAAHEAERCTWLPFDPRRR